MFSLNSFFRDKPASQKQFNLLRNFSLVSLCGFVLTTGLLSMFYRQQAIDDLVLSTEESNIALTQIMANRFWSDYGTFLSSTQMLSDEELVDAPETRRLYEEIKAELEGLAILKVKVFDLQGRTVFSTEFSQIGDDKSQSSGFLSAKSGQVVSQLGHRDTFKALQNTLENRDLLSSYVPIRVGRQNDEIVGVFEVYTDVTPLLSRIHQTQQKIVLGSLLLLTMLYGVLVVFVRKADELLIQQYQQVQASEGRYRQQSEKLERVLADLKQTQAQMVHSEKMSGLGQLVAGIAHEINNPVNFIHGNIEPVKRYIQDVLSHLRLYERHYPNPPAEIQAHAEELDMDFVKEDLGKTLASMAVGTERIREIVLSLRNFSRMDEATYKMVNIHEGIESTLLILQHRLKARSDRADISIVRDYGELPLVECYAGQLNQVFMNILSNGIDAIDSKFEKSANENEIPQITIRTEKRSENVAISISDNGTGISPTVKAHIFDPFFTTKAVGKGTGMGMAISHQLITEKHGGKIECFSDEGVGTEFMVEIPIQLHHKPSSPGAR